MNYYFNNADKLVYNADREYDPQRALRILEDDYGIVTNHVVANTLAAESGVLDEDQSNRFRNDQFSQQIRVGFKQNRKKYRLNVGVSVNPTMMKSENLLNSEKTSRNDGCGTMRRSCGSATPSRRQTHSPSTIADARRRQQ